jgi:hypothetical protein
MFWRRMPDFEVSRSPPMSPVWTTVWPHGMMNVGASDGKETKQQETADEPRSEAANAYWTNPVCDHGGADDPNDGNPIDNLTAQSTPR